VCMPAVPVGRALADAIKGWRVGAGLSAARVQTASGAAFHRRKPCVNANPDGVGLARPLLSRVSSPRMVEGDGAKNSIKSTAERKHVWYVNSQVRLQTLLQPISRGSPTNPVACFAIGIQSSPECPWPRLAEWRWCHCIASHGLFWGFL